MTRRRSTMFLAVFALIGSLCACSGAAPEPEAAATLVPGETAATAATSVPQERTGSPEPAATSSSPARVAAGETRKAAAETSPAPDLSRFVAAVRQELPEITVDRRDEEVATLGQQTCDAVAAGKKTAVVVREIRAQGVDGPQAQRLVTLARDTACPR
jgi:hypothetical protein